MIDLKPATLLKVTLLHGCFSRFLNSTNGTKHHICNNFKPIIALLQYLIICFRDRLQVMLLVLSEFKRINELLYPENVRKPKIF